MFVSQYEGPEYVNYKQAYQSLYGDEPGIYSDYVHDNVLMLGKALQKCTEVDCVRKELQEITAVRATGLLNFDEDGEIINKPYSLYKIEGKKFVEL